MVLENELRKLSKDELKVLFENIKPSNIVRDVEVQDLIYKPYWLVKVEFPDLVSNNQLTNAVDLFIKSEPSLYVRANQLEPNEIMQLLAYYLDRFKKILELEQEILKPVINKQTIAFQNIVGDKLNIFGELNTINRLANGNIDKYDYYKQLPYHVIFDKLYMDNIEAHAQNELQKKNNIK